MLDELTVARLSAGEGLVLLALSGGGDSVALLHLAAQRLGAARLRAAIVDHGLREGSAGDARRACAIAQGLGVAAEILTLAWPQEARRSQQTARRARYAALCAAARRIGAGFVLVAHTRDDQAETVFMRAARGSGWRGLAGMRALAPVPVWPDGRGLMLARPLLGVRRATLREVLRERGADWIEDPANANVGFARVRARLKLAELARAGFDPMRLATLAEALAVRARALDRTAASVIDQAARFDADKIHIRSDAWQGPEIGRTRALQVLLAAASGQAREPAFEQVAELERQFMAPEFCGATLGGARLRAEPQSVVIDRDRGALVGRAGGAGPAPPLALDPDTETVWDGRAAFTAPESGWSVVAEGGDPMLTRGDLQAPHAAAGGRWLLRAHVDHLLIT